MEAETCMSFQPDESWRLVPYAGIPLVTCTYAAVAARLRTARVYSPPQRELFVGFGTIGGWLVTAALLGSSPVITLPLFAFQFFVAMPVSLISLIKVAPKFSYSGYHTAAVWLHILGLLLPIAVLVIANVTRQ